MSGVGSQVGDGAILQVRAPGQVQGRLRLGDVLCFAETSDPVLLLSVGQGQGSSSSHQGPHLFILP